MPPRYAYWTIVVDEQPTAFRSASVEEIMPTFNRLKAKQPTAVLKWFQNGKLWDSELAAREAQIRRGEEGRRRDKNQQPDRAPRPATGKLDWKPKETGGAERPPKADWSPRAAGARPRPEKRDRPSFRNGPNQRDAKPWSPKPSGAKPWGAKPWSAKPRDTRDQPKLEWSPREKPTGSRPERRDRPPFKSKTNQHEPRPWAAKPRDPRDRPPYKGGSSHGDSKPRGAKPRDTRDEPKLEWSPRQTPSAPRPEKPARQPFKGGAEPREAKRDAKWRPGGEHRDPRQKYKDAKKAKWTKFKAQIRKRTPRKP